MVDDHIRHETFPVLRSPRVLFSSTHVEVVTRFFSLLPSLFVCTSWPCRNCKERTASEHFSRNLQFN